MKQVQSYYSVIFKYRFNIYEMRILLKIVQRARIVTLNKGKYSDFLKKAYSSDGINVNFAFSVEELRGSRTHNYEPLKAALRHMRDEWVVEYYDKSSKIWRYTSIISNIELDEGNGMVRFTCAKWLLDFILDFRNGGYREYDFDIAMSLHNPFATRFYLITCSQTSTQTWRLDSLRSILGLKDKYPRTYDFMRRVIDPAMKELEKRNVNGFKYEYCRQYSFAEKKYIELIKIIPIKRGNKEINISEQITEYNKNVPELVTLYLSQSFGFSWKELKPNQKLLHDFTLLDNWQSKFYEICERTRRKRKNHGYMIQAWRSHLHESNIPGY